ncbi:MAG: glycosyltransferase [Proteobacteria bacterium]|nr:glycosyltransferase [Pseudomonadota bacterium]MBU4414583.1 glycosyltransferase [Pseudomonadota bacterium]
MKVCIISKYPPIQGGISAKTYWLAQGLAEKGIETHVITNGNCVEKEYFIDDSPPEIPSNLIIHFVDPDIPWHIPYSELYISRLLDKTLEVINEYHIDLIDTHYLIPYGIVGYLASKIKGIPYIVRHGGSDIKKFVKDGVFRHLLRNVIQDATAIITDEKNRGLFENINSNVLVLPRYIPDERFFKPYFISREIPTFAYIGKINYYWKYKSLDKIVSIFSGIKEEHKLLFVGQGKGFKDFSRFVESSGLKSYEFRKFVHPASMPNLLNNIDYLLYFVQDNPIRDYSNIVGEALCSGVALITDKAMDIGEHKRYIEIVSSDQIITLTLDDIETAQKEIHGLIKDRKGTSQYNSKAKYDFNSYINANLEKFNEI